jgi:hypothetical protein
MDNSSPKDYDAPNPGTALVGFEVTIPANSKTAITVSLIPQSGAKKKSKKIEALEEWSSNNGASGFSIADSRFTTHH